MFEFGVDQASGLRAATLSNPPLVAPVAATARPGQAYELICAIAAQLKAAGRDAVIVDGSAIEVGEEHAHAGGHLGLLHALLDASVGSLGAPMAPADWLVMPGSRGLQILQQTARAAGAAVALSRLLAPFASGAVVLLYAPAPVIASLFTGLRAKVVVPVLDQAQSTIDAYGSLKVLHGAGLCPVLAPLQGDAQGAQAPMAQVLRNVSDCAQRYLQYQVEQWSTEDLGQRVREAALAAPWPPVNVSGNHQSARNNFSGIDLSVPARWS